MSNTVFCRKFKKELPKMDRPPYPGPNGEEIFNTVSKEAWQEWLSLQTMLINEKQLSLADSSSRKYLNDQLNRPLFWLCSMFFESSEICWLEAWQRCG